MVLPPIIFLFVPTIILIWLAYVNVINHYFSYQPHSCHESRMGRMSVVFWPGVGILTLLGVALIF